MLLMYWAVGPLLSDSKSDGQPYQVSVLYFIQSMELSPYSPGLKMGAGFLITEDNIRVNVKIRVALLVRIIAVEEGGTGAGLEGGLGAATSWNPMVLLVHD